MQREPTVAAATHADYDVLPYPSMPIPYTQPAHLAALGKLFGLSPPAADRARVLELGCAAGGNITPLAARFPNASFLGIDLSQRHIAEGRQRIEVLQLTNIRLLQADLTTLDLGTEQFDYVVCHGVFSWVPKAAQEAIFRLCQKVLTRDGMATISYNVLPGWHLRTAIRDLCLRYAGSESSPQHRVARARAALAKIAAAADQTEPYGLLLQTEARRLKSVPAAYILGEFLAPDNAPCYVRDFINQASAYDLDYLCEADLFAAVPHTLDASIRNRVTEFSEDGRSAAEQDIDFLTGRLFRRSVLVRSRPADAQALRPDPARLQALHISCSLRLDVSGDQKGAAEFVDDKARPLKIRDPAVGRAIKRLVDAYPATLCLDTLTQGCDPTTCAQIEAAVFAIVMCGRADISALPLTVGQAQDVRPTAWSFARVEAASRQAWITSLRHTGGPRLPILRALLPLMDGTRDRNALRAELLNALQSGAVPMPATPPGQDGSSVYAIADRYLDQTLEYLSRQGIIISRDSPSPECDAVI